MAGWLVLIEGDNTASLGAATKWSSKSPGMQELIRRMFDVCERWKIVCRFCHTPGVLLHRPDQISRHDPVEEPRARLSAGAFGSVERRFGRFNEWVGSEREHPSVLDVGEADAARVWMHPTFTTVGSALRLVAERASESGGEAMRAVVLVPDDPTAAWRPLLRHFSVEGRLREGGTQVEMCALGQWRARASTRPTLVLSYPRAAGAVVRRVWLGGEQARVQLEGAVLYSPRGRRNSGRGELLVVLETFDPALESTQWGTSGVPTVAVAELLLCDESQGRGSVTAGSTSHRYELSWLRAGRARAGGSFALGEGGKHIPWQVDANLLWEVGHMVASKEMKREPPAAAAGSAYVALHSLQFKFDFLRAERDISLAFKATGPLTLPDPVSPGWDEDSSSEPSTPKVRRAEKLRVRMRAPDGLLKPPPAAGERRSARVVAPPDRWADHQQAAHRGTDWSSIAQSESSPERHAAVTTAQPTLEAESGGVSAELSSARAATRRSVTEQVASVRPVEVLSAVASQLHLSPSGKVTYDPRAVAATVRGSGTPAVEPRRWAPRVVAEREEAAVAVAAPAALSAPADLPPPDDDFAWRGPPVFGVQPAVPPAVPAEVEPGGDTSGMGAGDQLASALKSAAAAVCARKRPTAPSLANPVGVGADIMARLGTFEPVPKEIPTAQEAGRVLQAGASAQHALQQKLVCRSATQRCRGCDGLIGVGNGMRASGTMCVHNRAQCIRDAARVRAPAPSTGDRASSAERLVASTVKLPSTGLPCMSTSGVSKEKLAPGPRSAKLVAPDGGRLLTKKEQVLVAKVRPERVDAALRCMLGECDADGPGIACVTGCGRQVHAKCVGVSKSFADLGQLRCAVCRAQEMSYGDPIPPELIRSAAKNMLWELSVGKQTTAQGYAEYQRLEKLWVESVGGGAVALPRDSEESMMAFLQWLATDSMRGRSFEQVWRAAAGVCARTREDSMTKSKRVQRMHKDVADSLGDLSVPCTQTTRRIVCLMLGLSMGSSMRVVAQTLVDQCLRSAGGPHILARSRMLTVFEVLAGLRVGEATGDGHGLAANDVCIDTQKLEWDARRARRHH